MKNTEHQFAVLIKAALDAAAELDFIEFKYRPHIEARDQQTMAAIEKRIQAACAALQRGIQE